MAGPRPAFARAGAGLLLFGLLAMAAATAGVLSSADVVPPSVAYRDGPPPGFSGGFGEQSCHACHFSAEPNQPPGAMSLSGLPERYTAGETYVITLTLSRPGMAIGGFQLTARFADSGAQAGSLAAGEGGRVRVATSGGVEYAIQRDEGSRLVAADTARWILVWAAPAAGGTVLVHAAGNAADGDDSALDDFVYTGVWSAEPAGR